MFLLIKLANINHNLTFHPFQSPYSPSNHKSEKKQIHLQTTWVSKMSSLPFYWKRKLQKTTSTLQQVHHEHLQEIFTTPFKQEICGNHQECFTPKFHSPHDSTFFLKSVLFQRQLRPGKWCDWNYLPSHTVDGKNPANRLRLVVYHSNYMVLYIPGGAGFPATVVLNMLFGMNKWINPLWK